MREFAKQPTLLLRSQDDPPFLKGIVGECSALGWRVINMTYASNYVDFQPTPIGAILASIPWDGTVERLRERGIPIVCTSFMEASHFEQDGRVLLDRRRAGRLAADILAERGFKELGYVTFEKGVPGDPLFLGFQEQAQDHDATVRICRLAGIPAGTHFKKKYEEQLKATATWLKEQPTPLAMLAVNYRMGVRLIASCDLAGLSVPEQVAVLCRDNVEGLCETAPVPLSAIDMNRSEQGCQAVRLMKRLVDGEAPPPDPIWVPVKGFVERRSTDILAVSDPRVARAIRFIWDHIDSQIMVDDVAREVGTSRNTLERAFRRSLNRGVNAELRRKRMEHCKELLRSTRMNLTEIAHASGLNSSRHLHRSFQSAFGLTPNAYRKSLATDSG